MSYDHASLKDLVDFMARALVDHPDEVEVNEVVGEHTTVVELSVSKEDLGKVIGKQGENGPFHENHPECRQHQVGQEIGS